MSLTDSELTLGVLFAGRVHRSFDRAAQNVRNTIQGLTGSLDSFSKKTKKAAQNSKDFTKDMQGMGKHAMKTSQGFQRLANSLKFIAAYGAAARMIWGTVSALKAGGQAVVDYDQALKNLQAITSASDVEINALGDSIKYVAATTKFSATEVAQAAIILGQAGFTASEQLSAVEAVANLSTGTLTSMATSADLLTTAIRAFAIDAQESNRVSDVFASAVNRSKLTVDKLRIAFNYLGPIANQVGLNLEETASGAMVLANAGLRGSTIGTGFRRVLQMLVKPSEKMRILIAGTGRDITKLNPALNDMSTVMNELQMILGKNVGKAERARRAFELFGLRGASVAAAFAEAGAEGFNKMYNEVLRVGTASAMAEKQMEGLGVMIKNTFDKLQVLAVTLGEGGLADAFKSILIPIRSFIDLLTRFAESTHGKVIVAVVALTTSLIALRLAFKFLIVTMSAFATGATIAAMKTMAADTGMLRVAVLGLKGAFGALAAAMAAAPWTAVALLISGVVVGLLSYRRHLDQTIPRIQKTVLEKGKLVDKLDLYKKKLSETKEGTAEYRSIIQRVGEDFEELKPKIDAVTGAWIDNGKAFEETMLKHRREQFLEMIKLYDEAARKIENQQDKMKEAEKQRGIMTREANRQQHSLLQKMESESLPELGEEVNEAAGKLREYQTLMRNAALSITQSARSQGNSLYASFDEIQSYLMEKMDLTKDKAAEVARIIKAEFEQMQFGDKQGIGQTGQDMIDFPTQEKQISMLGDEWIKLYDSLSEARKVDLIETINTMQAKIGKMREGNEGIKLTRAQMEAKEQEIIAETLRKFSEAETDKEKRARETAAAVLMEWTKVHKGQEKIQLQELNNWYRAQKAKITKNISDEKAYRETLTRLDRTYDKKRRRIEASFSRFKLQTSEEKKAKETVDAILLEWARLNQSKEDLQLRELDNWYHTQRTKLAQNVEEEAAYRETLSKLDQTYDAKRRKIEHDFAKYKVETQNRALQETTHEMNRVDLLGMDELTQQKKILAERLSITRDYWEEWVRTGEISIDQYHQLLEEGHYAEIVSLEELADKKKRINEEYFQSFTRGMRDALVQIRTFSELMFDIGYQISEQIAQNMTDNIWEFIYGTKSAGEAMKDFAKVTLKWLSKILIKWSILRMMQSAFFGDPGVGGGTVGQQSQLIVPEFHGGGITGKEATSLRSISADVFKFAKKFHQGLLPGEMPAILKKNEGVFTPEQMKALGSGGGPSIEVNLTYNAPQGGGNGSSRDDALNMVQMLKSELRRLLLDEKRAGGMLDKRSPQFG